MGLGTEHSEGSVSVCGDKLGWGHDRREQEYEGPSSMFMDSHGQGMLSQDASFLRQNQKLGMSNTIFLVKFIHLQRC